MGKLGTYELTVEIDGRDITFEAGLLAQQAGGSIVTSLGDTKVLTTTTASSRTKEFLGFFPLTIEFEERMYANGRIPGSFFKREGRPSENAILACRLTDRPLRPTFADGLRNEIQVVNTVLQTTQVDPYDVIAMNGASLATMLAGVPFAGPTAATRYAMLRDGSWVAFPTFEELEGEAVFQMVVAGRLDENGNVAILMIEAEATPDSFTKIEMGATAPTEEVIGQAIEDVKPILKALCDAQLEFVKNHAPRNAGEFKRFIDYSDEVFDALYAMSKDKVKAIYSQGDVAKQDRDTELFAYKDEVIAALVAKGVGDLEADELEKQAKEAFRSVEKKVVRRKIVEEGVRIDGRKLDEMRAVSSVVDVLPMTHGSGIFQRGETQALSVLALGTTRENQRLDTLDPSVEKYYMHHYNMPPYSTGEAGRVGSPKRREIGHGLLAERALVPVLPELDQWPYTMRVVSDVLSSNGSTSMASVCGSTLALMAGGVPIKAPVAGIAMGLIYEDGEYRTLTDIQGVEDFYGDMDFKVAGTREFVTALQLDTKLAGLPADILAAALLQAKDARLAILDVMEAAISEPRAEVAQNAPSVEVVRIPQDKIGEIIGPRGKIIKEIQEQTGAQIDVEEEGGGGVVRIYGKTRIEAQAALDWVNGIANPVLPEKGERYHATVVKTVDFGAFVSLTPGTDGLLHISELKKIVGKRLDHAEEAVQVGEKVMVEVIDILDGGRKFKLEYVGEIAEGFESERGGGGGDRSGGGDRGGRSGGDRSGGGGGDRSGGGDRGGRSGGDRGGRSGGGDRDRAPRGDRDGGSDRGGRSDGDRDRAPRGDSKSESDGGRKRSDRDGASRRESSGDASNEGGGERTRTRTRSRSRD
jgi:polyribonucleotide nucleotidyltransferase